MNFSAHPRKSAPENTLKKVEHYITHVLELYVFD